MNFVSSFFGGGGSGGGGRRPPPGARDGPIQYQNFLRAYPATFMARNDLEKGNKVLLPASVLAEISQGAMPHPMIFRVNSMRTKKTTYVGVLEFVAPEDTCILPLWVLSLISFIFSKNIFHLLLNFY